MQPSVEVTLKRILTVGTRPVALSQDAIGEQKTNGR
jgi:hypothetical protein